MTEAEQRRRPSDDLADVLAGLDETRIPAEQVPRGQALLCHIAGIDPTDCPNDAERRGYAQVGVSLILTAVFALFGWSCFLALCGLQHAVDEPIAGAVLVGVVAAVLTAAVLNFDRGLTGHSDGDLDALKVDSVIFGETVAQAAATPPAPAEAAPPHDDQPADDADDATEPVPVAAVAAPADDPLSHTREEQRARANELLHPVGDADRVVYLLRVAVAFAVACVFSLSAEAVFLKDDIRNQQISEQKIKHEREAKDNQTIVTAMETAYTKKRADLREDYDQYREDSKSARRGTRRHTCGPECRAAQKDAVETRDALQDLREAHEDPEGDFRQAERRLAAANAAVRDLNKGKIEDELTGGPMTKYSALFAYMWDHKATGLIWLFMTGFVLAVDLAALARKWQLRRSGYEHRRGMRSRLMHRVVVARTYEDGQLLSARRREHVERETLEIERRTDAARTDAVAAAVTERARRAGFASVEEQADLIEASRSQAEADVARRLAGEPEDAAVPAPPPKPAAEQPEAGAADPGTADPGTAEIGDETHWLNNELFAVDEVAPEDRFREGMTVRGREGAYQLLESGRKQKTAGGAELWKGVVVDGNPAGLSAGHEVAIKIHYTPKRAGSELASKRRRRALNEIQRTNALDDYAHVVQFVDAREDPRYVLLVTNWLPDGDLGYRWAHEPTRRLFDVVAVTLQMASAVKDSGLDHGDIKPGNALLDGTTPLFNQDAPRIRVADWELAREPGTLNAAEWLPRATARYSAPQVRYSEGTSDPRDTLYSLACVLWTGVTGTPPGTYEFGPDANIREGGKGDELLATLAKQRERGERVVMLHHLAPQVPRSLSELVDRWLRFGRRARCAEVGSAVMGAAEKELLEILERLAADVGTPAQIDVGPDHALEEPQWDDHRAALDRTLAETVRGWTSSDGDAVEHGGEVDLAEHPAFGGAREPTEDDTNGDRTEQPLQPDPPPLHADPMTGAVISGRAPALDPGDPPAPADRGDPDLDAPLT